MKQYTKVFMCSSPFSLFNRDIPTGPQGPAVAESELKLYQVNYHILGLLSLLKLLNSQLATSIQHSCQWLQPICCSKHSFYLPQTQGTASQVSTERKVHTCNCSLAFDIQGIPFYTRPMANMRLSPLVPLIQSQGTLLSNELVDWLITSIEILH